MKRVRPRGARAPAAARARRAAARRVRRRRRALDPRRRCRCRARRRLRLATRHLSRHAVDDAAVTLTRRGWSLLGAAVGLVVGSFLLGAIEMLVLGGRRGRAAARRSRCGSRSAPASSSRSTGGYDRTASTSAARAGSTSPVENLGAACDPAARRHRLVRRGSARRALPRAAALAPGRPPAPRTASRPVDAAGTGSARSRCRPPTRSVSPARSVPSVGESDVARPPARPRDRGAGRGREPDQRRRTRRRRARARS